MQTFDDIQVSRPDLASSYLALLKAQPGRPLALFAPRRVGKTFFLDHDLRPTGESCGFIVVYADIWLKQDNPLAAINHALEESLDDIRVPKSRIAKLGKSSIRKASGFSVNLEIEEPQRRALPEDQALRLDALIGRLAEQSGRHLLLMLDEVQALGEARDGESVIATLRAVLQKRKAQLFAVFTGSSQEALSTMMVAAGGPMYQFAQLLDFPRLGDEYLELLKARFRQVHKSRSLDLDALRGAFEHLGHKPALMKDLVKAMSADGLTDVAFALKRMAGDEKHVAGWRAQLQKLAPVERALLVLIAQGKPPLGRDTLTALDQGRKNPPVTMGKVRMALERLKKARILTKSGAAYVIEDRLLSDYVAALDIRKELAA